MPNKKLKVFNQKFPWEDKKHTFRTDPFDFIEVEGSTEYEGSKTHKLLRKLEIKEGNKWKPYPVAAWVDNGSEDSEYGLYSIHCIADGKGAIIILRSPCGVPDGTLLSNAEKKGILTKTYDL